VPGKVYAVKFRLVSLYVTTCFTIIFVEFYAHDYADTRVLLSGYI